MQQRVEHGGGPNANPNANINAPQAMLGGDGSFARAQTDGLKICTSRSVLSWQGSPNALLRG